MELKFADRRIKDIVNDTNIDWSVFLGNKQSNWNIDKKSAFIESCLIMKPASSFLCITTCSEEDEETTIIVDGKKRLETLIGFIENKYRLQGLYILKELNGLFYNDLPTNFKVTIDRLNLKVYHYIGLKEKGKEYLYSCCNNLY